MAFFFELGKAKSVLFSIPDRTEDEEYYALNGYSWHLSLVQKDELVHLRKGRNVYSIHRMPPLKLEGIQMMYFFGATLWLCANLYAIGTALRSVLGAEPVGKEQTHYGRHVIRYLSFASGKVCPLPMTPSVQDMNDAKQQTDIHRCFSSRF